MPNVWGRLSARWSAKHAILKAGTVTATARAPHFPSCAPEPSLEAVGAALGVVEPSWVLRVLVQHELRQRRSGAADDLLDIDADVLSRGGLEISNSQESANIRAISLSEKELVKSETQTTNREKTLFVEQTETASDFQYQNANK